MENQSVSTRGHTDVNGVTVEGGAEQAFGVWGFISDDFLWFNRLKLVSWYSEKVLNQSY